MHRIDASQPHALYDTASTRRIEQSLAATLPPHVLMQRAGKAIAQLALALAPHARTVWIACGPGNNGGDGLEAATHLAGDSRHVIITWLGSPESLPEDARRSWEKARSTPHISWSDAPPEHLTPQDLCIDALLGIGVRASVAQPHANTSSVAGSVLAQWLSHIHRSSAPVLAVDVPSGLDADTGQYAAGLAPSPSALDHRPAPARHTLSLLTLKPGLFTSHGRDAAGQVWLDELQGATPSPPLPAHEQPIAWLTGPPERPQRHHASHKGTYGDVAVVGGEGLAQRGMGMTGAAMLAASAALHAGAGRVLVSLLGAAESEEVHHQPELMVRRFEALELESLAVVCGCGGGQAVRAVLPAVLQRADALVLDADALNVLSTDGSLQQTLKQRSARQRTTVITPHPLEAARLLHIQTDAVQCNRLAAAQQLANRFQCVAVLKGSGTVIACPWGPLALNPTGNARLATAGTGDVLAGMVGAFLAQGMPAMQAATTAVYLHGKAADQWPHQRPLTASDLAKQLK